MVFDKGKEKVEVAIKEAENEISITVEQAIKKIETALPADATDDPVLMILSMIGLGAKVTVNYGVVTEANGNSYWGFTVNVSYKFMDNTTWAGVFQGTNIVSVLQQAINGLVSAIQYWKTQNPGY